MAKNVIVGPIAILAIGVAACDGSGNDPDVTERLQALDRDLSLGASGPDVQAVNEYLHGAGYFPNDELARRFPAWRPIISTPVPDPMVYGQPTADAIYTLQIHSGLPASGILDAATRDILKRPRCGVPDGIERPDPANKYAIQAKWSISPIRWRAVSFDDVSFNDGRAALAAAVNTWSAQFAGLILTETTTNNAQITVSVPANYSAVCGDPNLSGMCAIGTPGSFGSSVNIYINPARNWSVTLPTPANSVDLQTVLLHELGHALGLGHSDSSQSAMIAVGVGTRNLGVDDKLAVSLLYDTMVAQLGSATDIAVGPAGQIWFVTKQPTPGGFTVCFWQPNNRGVCPSGGAVRIAIDSNGFPWLVNSSGSIFRRNSAFPLGGNWFQMPGTATDIGASTNGAVWAVSTTPATNGFRTMKWNPSSNNWDADTATPNFGARRIAVDSIGQPWVVNNTGDVYRRSTTSPSSGNWTMLPRPSTGATDIGAGPQLSPAGYAVWVAAGSGVFAWDGQNQAMYPPPRQNQVAVPARNIWVSPSSFAIGGGSQTAVAVDSNATPYFVQNNGSLVWAAK